VGKKHVAIITLSAALPVIAAFVAYAPAAVDLGLAVVAAIGWIVWLEHHPEPPLGKSDVWTVMEAAARSGNGRERGLSTSPGAMPSSSSSLIERI